MPGLSRTLLASVLTLMMWMAGPAAAETILSAEEARAQQESGALTVIDIRHPSEWRETGVPEGSKTITMHAEGGAEAFLANILAGVGGDRSAPVGLICATGARSSWASAFLESQGFTRVANIREGMLGRGPNPGWINRGLPVESVTP